MNGAWRETTRIQGGRKFTRSCDKCRTKATFYEVESSEDFKLWGIKLFGDKERLVQCGECLAVFKTDEAPPEIDAAKAAKELAKAEKAAAKEQKRREQEVDRKLKELKKLAGK